jgi:NAD-dependent deacetylase
MHRENDQQSVMSDVGHDQETDQRQIAELIALARTSRAIVAFTGAGISTESGIPDYRGPGGVWERNAPPTLSDFQTNPAKRRAYWEDRRNSYPAMLSREPNVGHRALAALAEAGRLIAVITQNIDGLHQAAGLADEDVVELHGTTHRVRCLDCGTTWPAAEIQALLIGGISEPHCPRCGGPLRSATVLFGESLPEEALRRAVALARESDLFLVVGSSLIVNPAARLPVLAQESGARLALINRTPTPLDALADIHISGEAGPTLAALAAGVLGTDWEHRSA